MALSVVTMSGVAIICRLVSNPLSFVWLFQRSHDTVAAENLFLSRQIALYKERGVKPNRGHPEKRLKLLLILKHFDWKGALTIVQPRPLIRWHRLSLRLLWRHKSRPGRSCIPVELRQLIREMALNKVKWSEEPIANELLFKPGTRVSPRTVRKYIPKLIR